MEQIRCADDQIIISEDELWQHLLACQGQAFCTAKGLRFTYVINGGELFVSRKSKSITKATVVLSLHRAQAEQSANGCVSGPKKMGTFGASYLYPIFLTLGVCTSTPLVENVTDT